MCVWFFSCFIWGLVCFGFVWFFPPLGIAEKHLSFGDGCEIYTNSLNTLPVRMRKLIVPVALKI